MSSPTVGTPVALWPFGNVEPIVIAPFGSWPRTFCVIAIAAIAIVVPPSASAQDAPAPPWWRKLQVPDAHIQSILLQHVLATPVSTFDGKLPPIRLDDWLFATLAPRVEVLRTPLVNWDVTFCHAYADGPNPSIVTASGPELCAKGTIRVSAERNIHLVILVANAVRGARAWHPTPPAMRDVYIERMKELSPTDSFDVSDLGGLPDLLQVPFDQWPKVRFKTEIVWDPPKPLPGDTVRFSISVRNTGGRSANRAWVEILIAPCCGKAEVRRDWFPFIAAGQSVRADVAVPLPEGRATAIVTVKHGPSIKTVHQIDQDAQPTVVVVDGHPSLPR